MSPKKTKTPKPADNKAVAAGLGILSHLSALFLSTVILCAPDRHDLMLPLLAFLAAAVVLLGLTRE